MSLSSSSEEEQARIAACQEVCLSVQSSINKNDRQLNRFKRSRIEKIKLSLKIGSDVKGHVSNPETCDQNAVLLERYLATSIDVTPNKTEIGDVVSLSQTRKSIPNMRKLFLAVEILILKPTVLTVRLFISL